MSSQNPSLAGNFESAAQQMLDALHKASAELSQAVSDCIDQLSAYNLGLQQSLNEQLQQIHEKFQTFIEQNSDELENHKEKLLEKLSEFEQSQIETIASSGDSVREALAAHTGRLKDDISHLVEQRLEELEEILTVPEQQISQQSETSVSQLSENTEQYQSRVDTSAQSGEELVASRASAFEADLEKLVDEWKQSVNDRFENAQRDFQERNAQVSKELEKFVEDTRLELANGAAQAERAVQKALESGQEKIASAFTGWREDTDVVYESFLKVLKEKRSEIETTMRADLDRAATVGKDDINHLVSEARERIESAHKAYRGTLKRLEQDYQRRLDSLLSRIETTVSETLRRSHVSSSIHQRVAKDLLDKLKSQLAVRGSEILAQLEKLSQQLEVEYARSSQGTEERIDLISSSALDALDKQIYLMKNELKKISKVFQDELDELEAHVVDIEVAGKKAAETVMTYRSAILSLGGD